MTLPTHRTARRKRIAAVPVIAALAAGVPAFTSTTASAAAPTVPVAAVVDQTLVVTGTKGPDTITLGLGTNTLVIDLGTGATQSFDRSTFTTVSASLGSGDDSFLVEATSSNPPFTVDGGSGNDDIRTGDGADTLFGGAGNDTLNGGFGDDVIHGGGGADVIAGSRSNDTVFGDGGNDILTWAPGDGSDVVDGGSGSHDDLRFDGANINEVMNLVAVGAHAVFSRDIASIQVDLVNVEQLDLRTFLGTDTVAVGDLSGTNLRAVNVDLGALGGGPDAQADTVTVDGTPNPDRVTIAAPGPAIAVSGLSATVAVTNPDPTDLLHVATFAGNDRVTVDSTALGRITLSANLGADES
jgi:hypothetical protein